MSHLQHIDDRQLMKSLDGDVAEKEEAAILEHLESCESCREKLARLSSDDRSQSRIVSALQVEAGSVRSRGAAGDSRLIPIEDGEAEDALLFPSQYLDAPSDFAVSFLEPTSREDATGRFSSS